MQENIWLETDGTSKMDNFKIIVLRTYTQKLWASVRKCERTVQCHWAGNSSSKLICFHLTKIREGDVCGECCLERRGGPLIGKRPPWGNPGPPSWSDLHLVFPVLQTQSEIRGPERGAGSAYSQPLNSP